MEGEERGGERREEGSRGEERRGEPPMLGLAKGRGWTQAPPAGMFSGHPLAHSLPKLQLLLRRPVEKESEKWSPGQLGL